MVKGHNPTAQRAEQWRRASEPASGDNDKQQSTGPRRGDTGPSSRPMWPGQHEPKYGIFTFQREVERLLHLCVSSSVSRTKDSPGHEAAGSGVKSHPPPTLTLLGTAWQPGSGHFYNLRPRTRPPGACGRRCSAQRGRRHRLPLRTTEISREEKLN